LLSKPAFAPGGNLSFNAQPTYNTTANGGTYNQSVTVPNLNTINYFVDPDGIPVTCSNASTLGYLAANTGYPDWLSTLNAAVDLRVTYV